MASRHRTGGSTQNVDVLLGFVVGTAIGAAIGVLLAQKSGAELRADLREVADRTAETFRKAQTGGTGDPLPEGDV